MAADAAVRPAEGRMPAAERLVSGPPTALPVRTATGAELTGAREHHLAAWGASQPPMPRLRMPPALLSFVMVVVFPVIIATIYYGIIATPQYVAEFRFGLRSAESARTEPGTLFSAAPAFIGVDSYALVQYVGSRAILEDIGRSLDLRAMFSSPRADWLSRLSLPVPAEDLLIYWKSQVDAFFDATNGTIVVRTRAFSPEDALRLAQGILACSERLVNNLSARARNDALRDAEKEVKRAERRLSTALVRLREFRDREAVIDPRKAAEANATLDTRVRGELIRANTELSILRQYMRQDAPSVKMLEARIQSLEEQRRLVESEVTETQKTKSETLSRIMGVYEQLESERNFAENAYQRALQALDRARLNADRQHVYLAAFVQPTLPERPLHPRRWYSLGLVLIIAFATWAIGSLAVRSIRDHL